jgi:hypothetical protein
VRLLDIGVAGALQVRFFALAPGPGALSRLLLRTRALDLASPHLIRAGYRVLPSRVCCRPVWQLGLVRLFGKNGAFLVFMRATFTLRTLHGNAKSCIYLACALFYCATVLLGVRCHVWWRRHCSTQRVFTPETLPCTAAPAPAAAPSRSAGRPVVASRPAH